ncbi:hypothetical protein L1049_021488 [Liquidambar formosana]|uniref:Uncharacterized protein n=1 Tax=Liquidambar formosana TaxID=63359 RepID=A0AAP0N3A6_LIQFO
MDTSGFEGIAKRLELHFSGGDSDLRPLFDSRSTEPVVLDGVKPSRTADPSVVNQCFDSYVLLQPESESSLFVYPTKIIIKTRGTNQICRYIDQLKGCAQKKCLTLSVCIYTQGFFTLPPSGTFPDGSFKEEVAFLEASVRSFCIKTDVITPLEMPSHSLGVCIACDETHNVAVQHTPDGLYTIQVCMIQPHHALAEKNFGPKSYDNLGAVVAELHLVRDDRNPTSSPCRYSARSIHRDPFLMIDVTVTQEVRSYGYASFECVGSIEDVVQMLKKVVKVFDPATMSVSTTCINRIASTEVVLPQTEVSQDVLQRVSKDMENAVKDIGFKCRSFGVDKSTAVMFQTFSPPRGD